MRDVIDGDLKAATDLVAGTPLADPLKALAEKTETAWGANNRLMRAKTAIGYSNSNGLRGALVKAGAEFQKTVQAVQKEAVDQNSGVVDRSEEHPSELQSLMRLSYAVFCLYKNII